MLWKQTDFSNLLFRSKIWKLDGFILLVTDGDKSHYVYIKDFDRFMFHKTKNKNKKYFYKSCLQCFSSKNVLNNHKEVSLSINGAQSVRLEKGTVVFKKFKKKKKNTSSI